MIAILMWYFAIAIFVAGYSEGAASSDTDVGALVAALISAMFGLMWPITITAIFYLRIKYGRNK